LREWYPAARIETKLNHNKRKPGRRLEKPKRINKRPRITGAPKRNTRLEQVKELLRANGPMDRHEIREKADLPEGTVGYLLNKKNFRHLTNGKWDLHDRKIS
jgi:hypothetical protein